jgi:hypothetical protein
VIIVRLAGILFALIQITLALRLLLPFVQVPLALEGFVPTLLVVTDWWLAPFVAIIDTLDILGTGASLDTATEDGQVIVPTEFEPAVVVAMIGWALIAAFILFILRLIFRPVG